MSKNYHHRSPAQRYQLEVLYITGKTQKEIAELLAVHPSTVCRELKRNMPHRGRGTGQYDADKAQHKTDMRHKNKSKAVKMNAGIKDYITEKLNIERYSPELISVEGRRSSEISFRTRLSINGSGSARKGTVERIDPTRTCIYS